MAINEQEIQNIVRSVLQGMNAPAKTEAVSAAPTGSVLASVKDKKMLGIFDNIEDAIAAAKKAQKEIQPMPLEFREKIIANIRKKHWKMQNSLQNLVLKKQEWVMLVTKF